MASARPVAVSCLVFGFALPALCAAPPARAARDHEVVLQNAHCRLELDAGTGSILALRPGPASLAGPWFEVVEEDRRGLQPWETWERGTETLFVPGAAAAGPRIEADAGRALLTWEQPGGLRYTAEIALGPGDPGPRFRVTVQNTTGAALVDSLRLPVLRGVELGDPADDWFTWPHTLGATFRVRGFRPGEKLQHAYPDFLYMQWLDLYDREQGVYLGCLDDYGYCKELFIGRDEAGAGMMGIEFTGCWVAEAGDSWTTPWVQIVAHRGDWRSGADLYRTFAEAAFGPLDPPERVREMPTANCWLAHHASDADVAKLFEIQQQGPIHASYLMKSLNTSIPEGWDGFRGSALELQTAFARIRQLGGSPALFTFDRAPLMGRPNYAQHVGRWVSRRRDGSFAEGFRDLMPSPFDPDLVRARVGEAERWVEAFGLDEIHFDTAATTGPSLAGPSYDPELPQRPNEVPHYFKALYRAIRDAGRRHNPEFLLRAEHCADFFYPEFLTSTAHHFETGTLVCAHQPPADAGLLPILFRYTLPRHAALQMPSMSGSDFWTYGYGMGYGFHGGEPTWCFEPEVRAAECPPGGLQFRYRFQDAEWRRYYDFRVGFEEAVVDAERSDEVAEALIDGAWRACTFPGPLVAVTHTGGGREVTLGQWYHLSRTAYFAERFVGPERLDPRPVRLRVPTRLLAPQVRLFDGWGEVRAEWQLRDGRIELDLPDPTCFALEVYEGPSVSLHVEELAYPGEATELAVEVSQPEPRAAQLSFYLPAGWPPVDPLAVPARPTFRAKVRVAVPAGIFGRNYPIKAVLRSGRLQRTAATHLRVMDPLTVVYGFDVRGPEGPLGVEGVDPGRPARLTVTCINNTPRAAEVELRLTGEQVEGTATERLARIEPRELGDPGGALSRWLGGEGAAPPNVLVRDFDYSCAGVPTQPVRIEARLDGEPAFTQDAFPRTRVMDLNGDWRVHLTPRSQATVGGAERQDSLDTELVTPDVWDGHWPVMNTPIHLDEATRRDAQWAIYRRLVYLPASWQGADLWLRLTNTGAPWGAGGTLNLVYINGWPTGRLWIHGECRVSPFIVYGGWNLIAVASYSPNSLVAPYLFARTAPAPERLQPASASAPPAQAFLLLGSRPTGQGLNLVFIEGVPEGDYRRTNVAAGGEQVFIYFTIADAFLREPAGPVAIQVEYLDQGTAEFGLDYDSTDPTAPVDGAFKTAPPVGRTDSNEWRTHTFVLPDARLANREHLGADFRLWARGDDLRVRRVAVRRAP